MSSLRDRLTYRPGVTKRRPMLFGTLLLLGAAAILWTGYTKQIPLTSKGGQVVRAEFTDATHAANGTAVRVSGVDVGKVEKVELREGGRGALVEMRIDDDSGVTVRDDARASILWRTLLGRNVYIDLEPGSGDAPKLDGTIRKSHTKVQQELDAVAQPLNGDRRTGLQTTIDQLGRSLAKEESVGRSLEAVAPAARGMRKGLPPFRGTRPGDLPRAIRAGAGTLAALADSEEHLAGLIDRGRVALGVTAARSTELGATLDQAPSTLADTRTTLSRIERTLDVLDPTVEALKPGAEKLEGSLVALRPAVRKLDVVLDDAEPTVRSLSPAVKRLADAADPARQLIERTDPIVDRLNADTIPFLNETHPTTKLKNYQAIGPFFASIGGSSHTFDANGNIQNFQSFPDERSLHTLPCVLRLTDPTAPLDDKVNCSSLGDLVQQIIANQAPYRQDDAETANDADVGDRPEDFQPATPGGGGKQLRSEKGGDR
ncbi:MlaD family protein [Patulibacter sp. NPDC049589]|uniref:MlaD family protein n=1 Tax=Patulibacter sp. NPDC049589 TaxID=3154731 RepID=UPI00342EF010